MADINNIRTLEDLTNVVSQLYFNLNNIERLYYDMFINPIPMTLELERYDENGQLTTVTLNNRAKDRMTAITGVGSPNGVTSAITGTLYVDTASLTLYYKSTGSDAFGWVEIWSAQNFKQNLQYLPVNGNGSQLTSLNADSIASGTLNVINGGTGGIGFTGLVKGNGTSPFTSAIDGVDYLGPSGMTGLVCYFPIDTIPDGWLRCDGATYSRTTYARLFSKIGTIYGEGDGENTFNIPDLMNYYIRCWDGIRSFNGVQEGTVGTHKHDLEGTTGVGTPHSHSAGSLSHTHTITLGMRYGSDSAWRQNAKWDGGDVEYGSATATTDGEVAWTGTTAAESAHVHTLTGTTAYNALSQENNVLNKALVPIIKY